MREGETSYSLVWRFLFRRRRVGSSPGQGTLRPSALQCYNTLMIMTNASSPKKNNTFWIHLQQLMGDHSRHHELENNKELLYPPGERPGPFVAGFRWLRGFPAPHHDGYAVMTHMHIAIRWQRDILPGWMVKRNRCCSGQISPY